MAVKVSRLGCHRMKYVKFASRMITWYGSRINWQQYNIALRRPLTEYMAMWHYSAKLELHPDQECLSIIFDIFCGLTEARGLGQRLE